MGGKPILVVLGGPLDGHEFALVKFPTTIGRQEDQDVCLALYPAVSRHHARLIKENDEYWLEDIGSTRGTFLCGSDLKIQGRTKVVSGTSFRLGPWTTLKLLIEDIQKRVVQQAERLTLRLSEQLKAIPPARVATLKDQLISVLSRLTEVSGESEFLTLLGELAAAIEAALGGRLIMNQHDVRQEAKEESHPAPASREEDLLETLKTFFKSNLDDIINRLEARQSGDAHL